MVNSRAPWSVALLAVASGCTVANPLFILPDDGSGGGSTAAVTDTATATATATDTSGAADPTLTSTGGPGGSTTDPAVICGDGVRDPGEACDDGNATPGDGCESNCKPLFPMDPVLLPGTAGATAVAIGDVDHDGKNDLILADPTLPSIKRYINKGGIFEFDGFDILTPTPVTHLVAAELGSQPGADIAFVSGDFAYVFFETGVGPAPFFLQGEPRSLVAGEIEGGGPADLLLVDNLNGHLNYAIADNGGFSAQISISEVSSPQRGAIADVDADGTSDFVFTAQGGNGIGLWLDLKHDGSPTGPFATEATSASALALGNFALDPGHAPNAVFFGQLPKGSSLQVYVNKGAGSFEKFIDNVDAEDGVMKLLAPRLNSPTDDNIIALAPLKVQVLTLVAGKFKAGPSLSLNDELRDIAAGDLNNDGRPDLAVLGKNNCYILLNQAP